MLLRIDFRGLASSWGNCGTDWYFTRNAFQAFDGASVDLAWDHEHFLGADAHLSVTERGLAASGAFILDTNRTLENELAQKIMTGQIQGLSLGFLPNHQRAPCNSGPLMLDSPKVLEVSFVERPKDIAARFESLTWRVVSPAEVQ